LLQEGTAVATLVVDRDQISIPPGIKSLRAFRRWFHSDAFPEAGRICFFHNEPWVDMSKEQVFSHNQVKGEYNIVLGGLAKTRRVGRYFPDGILFVNEKVGFSTQPDGAFVTMESMRLGRVVFRPGKRGGFLEVVGALDMVLEVVSTSSVEKDTVTLPDLYWEAGILEYWLVDARSEELSFDILRYTSRGYVPTKKQSGWLKSGVFGAFFRLTRDDDELGNPEYTLHVKD
jgi:Uma2 family endonuclease